MFDVKKYKENLRNEWDKGAAPGWEKWVDFFIQCGGRELSNQLIKKAGIDPRQNVLDIATGAGLPAELLSSIVDHVTAIDMSAGMIAVAEQRAEKLGLKNIQPPFLRVLVLLPWTINQRRVYPLLKHFDVTDLRINDFY